MRGRVRVTGGICELDVKGKGDDTIDGVAEENTLCIELNEPLEETKRRGGDKIRLRAHRWRHLKRLHRI